ncbi:MAG: tRNA (N(6)-L-threonylcarbamoyladenosine(37)-C(2))-methylthiotransferase MtaB, partial [Bacteroidota bacterium]|nr:tRNA (N(6)-L-threonylcarbamoyladenosine(37)-C(2))-methylthiotransferase MtaB [Bacteroidota bacterium]
CIGADVIVGYPGETDQIFLETYNYISSLEISYLHVFTYSERDNTEAIKIKNRIDKSIRNKRSKMLRLLSTKKRRHFYKSQLGKSFEVLFESENKKGYITGFTENYIKIRMPWDPKLVNTLLKVKLEKIDDEGFVRVQNTA